MSFCVSTDGWIFLCVEGSCLITFRGQFNSLWGFVGTDADYWLPKLAHIISRESFFKMFLFC